MVNNAVKTIGTVISGVLNSTDVGNVEKLQQLNNNHYLNQLLADKDFTNISTVVINTIEEASEPEANLNVLKFYLHEIGLIFNCSFNPDYFEGVVY